MLTRVVMLTTEILVAVAITTVSNNTFEDNTSNKNRNDTANGNGISNYNSHHGDINSDDTIKSDIVIVIMALLKSS